MFRILLICACSVMTITTVASATTSKTPTFNPTRTHTGTHHHHHHTHPSREPAEHESFKFVYEQRSHMMVLVTGHKCYIFTLTDDERLSVHSDDGIGAIELRLLGALNTAAITTTTRQQLDKHLAHVCGHHTTSFYKETSH